MIAGGLSFRSFIDEQQVWLTVPCDFTIKHCTCADIISKTKLYAIAVRSDEDQTSSTATASLIFSASYD